MMNLPDRWFRAEGPGCYFVDPFWASYLLIVGLIPARCSFPEPGCSCHAIPAVVV